MIPGAMKLLSDVLTPDPTRRELLPVLGAIAETLLPAQPDKAAAAREQGQVDLANFHDLSGKQQTGHMQEVLAFCLTEIQQGRQFTFFDLPNF